MKELLRGVGNKGKRFGRWKRGGKKKGSKPWSAGRAEALFHHVTGKLEGQHALCFSRRADTFVLMFSSTFLISASSPLLTPSPPPELDAGAWV